jgi:hypothetical protein
VALGVQPRDPEAVVSEKLAWMREAAGERFHQLELNINLTAVGHQVPRYISAQLGLTAESLANSGSATALVGTIDEMCETLLRRRDTLGISYVLVSDELMEALAPVVERLAGH